MPRSPNTYCGVPGCGVVAFGDSNLMASMVYQHLNINMYRHYILYINVPTSNM